MKWILVWFLLCAVAVPPAFAENKEAASKGTIDAPYVLGPGDVLEVSVWKDEALAKVLPILPDGTFYFPLIGEIQAAGKTVAQIGKEIEGKISVYVSSPNVYVTVQQAGSMMIYVIGKVNRPGSFPLAGNMNVLQALATAGGLNPFAKDEKVMVIRETGGKQQILDFNYDEASSGKDLSRNIQLQRGDIVVVH